MAQWTRVRDACVCVCVYLILGSAAGMDTIDSDFTNFYVWAARPTQIEHMHVHVQCACIHIDSYWIIIIIHNFVSLCGRFGVCIILFHTAYIVQQIRITIYIFSFSSLIFGCEHMKYERCHVNIHQCRCTNACTQNVELEYMEMETISILWNEINFPLLDISIEFGWIGDWVIGRTFNHQLNSIEQWKASKMCN